MLVLLTLMQTALVSPEQLHQERATRRSSQRERGHGQSWRGLEQACLQSWKRWCRSVYCFLLCEEVLAVVPEAAPGVGAGQHAKPAWLLPRSAASPAKRRCSPCTSAELH